MQERNFEKSSSLFHELLQKYPNNAQILTNLGASLIASGAYKYEEARSLLNRAIELDSSLFLPHFLLGSIFEKEKKMKEAVDEWLLCVSKNPKLNVAHGYISEYYYNINDYSKALHHLDICISNEPDQAMAYWAKGRIVYQTKSAIEGELLFKQAASLERSEIDREFMYASSYFTVGKFDEARSRLTRYLENQEEYNPMLDKMFMILSQCYVGEKKMNEALGVLEHAIDLYEKNNWPMYMPFYVELCNMYKGLSKVPVSQVLKLYQKMLPTFNTNIDFVLDMAEFMIRHGAEKDAIVLLNYAIEKLAPDHRAHLMLAHTLLITRNFTIGIEHLNKSLEINPTHNAHYLASFAYRSLNLLDKAEFALEECLSMNPSFEPAKIDLARVKAENRKDDTISYIDTVLEENKDSIEVIEGISSILIHQMKLPQKALDVLGEFDKHNSSHTPIKVLICEAYQSLEKWDQAEEVIKDLILDNPTNPRGYVLLAKHYLSLKQYQKSLKQLGNSMNMDKYYILSYILSVECYTNLGQYDKVEETFKTLSSVFNDHWAGCLYEGAYLIDKFNVIAAGSNVSTPQDCIDVKRGCTLLEEALRRKAPDEHIIYGLLSDALILAGDAIKSLHYAKMCKLSNPDEISQGDSNEKAFRIS